MESETQSLADTAVKKRQFCSFRIAEHLFGVDILDVKEIKDEVVFTIVHHAPPVVRGVVNIRGHVYMVLDLRLLLGFDSKEADEASRVILFKQRVGESFGILVDSIGDMIEVEDSRIEYRKSDDIGTLQGTDRKKSDLSAGICKLEDELLIVLRAEKLFNAF